MNIIRKKRFFYFTLLYSFVNILSAQNIDLAKLVDIPKAKPFDFNGTLSTNGIYYHGDNQYRNPFSYFIHGSASVTIYQQITLPFSFSFSNQGHNYSYPTLPNRFSLNPTYKGYTLHIGEMNSSLSGYTMSGVPIMGIGFEAKELVPSIPLRLNIFFGRMQKAMEYDIAHPEILPAYKRLGYGGKIAFEKERYQVGLIIFGAKDGVNSLQQKPDSMFIYPQSNLVIGIEGGVEIVKNLKVRAEYAVTAVGMDIRDHNEHSGKGNLLQYIYKPKGTTIYKNAVKGAINYTFSHTTMGVNYERIDPEYKTLGIYYANQDIERVAFDVSQSVWKEKIALVGSFGYEHNNLNHSSEENMSRFSYSLATNMKFGEIVTINASYSNFTSIANVRSPFEDINHTSPIPLIDTINFRQLSQNASITFNIQAQKSENCNQTVNVNLSFQDAYDKNDGKQSSATSSQYYNATAGYALSFPKQKLNFNIAYITTINKDRQGMQLMMGPTLSANATFLKLLTTSLVIGYNMALVKSIRENDVINIRFNFAYRLFKRHTFNFSMVEQMRKTTQQPLKNDLTLTLGYTFTLK